MIVFLPIIFALWGGYLFALWAAVNYLLSQFCTIDRISHTCRTIDLEVFTLQTNTVFAVLSFLGAIFIGIAILYNLGKLLSLLGTQKHIDLDNYRKNTFTKKIKLNHFPKKIVYSYKLKTHYNNWREKFGLEIDQSKVEAVKSIDPDYEFIPAYRRNRLTLKRFLNGMKKINDLDKIKKTIDKDIKLFNDSIRLTVKNVENNEVKAIFLEPTQGFIFYTKGLSFITSEMDEKLLKGKNFEIEIKYKGKQGYNFKLWTK